VKNPFQQLTGSQWAKLAELAWCRLENHPHGDMTGWLRVIDQLPLGDGFSELNHPAPVLGRPAASPDLMHEQLLKLHPWRKGPLELSGVLVDTEWRSDWKWKRLEPHLDLTGQAILDVGCGNGYFGLRMLAAGARLVIGIDPTLIFVMQWMAMQKLCPVLENFVLPVGIEDLPDDCQPFDCVFSMGVLYHRRDVFTHLDQLKKLTKAGGQIVLETLVLESEGKEVLEPPGRYARMRNVHAVPSVGLLIEWLEQAGLDDARLLDISRTTTQEQRSTQWMTFESLSQSLDPENPAVTVEGHPAPVRAAFLINK